MTKVRHVTFPGVSYPALDQPQDCRTSVSTINMAATTPTDQGAPLTKQDLSECFMNSFATAAFARHVVAAMKPFTDQLIAEINNNKATIARQQEEINQLRNALRVQGEQFTTNLKTQGDQLRKTQETQEIQRTQERQKDLIVSGLDCNTQDVKATFMDTIKDKLKIAIRETDFSLRTMERRNRPRTNGNQRTLRNNPSTSGRTAETADVNQQNKTLCKITFSNIWKKREIYAARGGLKGTDIFLSESLTAQQQELFYKCRVLRREGKIKNTWSQDLKIYVRDLRDVRHEIATQSDLDILCPSRSTVPSPPPLPPAAISEINATMFSTPRPSLRSMNSDSEGSFHGFNLNMENNHTSPTHD